MLQTRRLVAPLHRFLYLPSFFVSWKYLFAALLSQLHKGACLSFRI